MGLLDKFKRQTNAPDTTADNTSPAKVDLVKRVNLAKEEVQKICITKAPLNGLKASVGLVLDFSGSMDALYRNGTMQALIEKILPLAMTFDDNGEMETWLFSNDCHRLPDISLRNLDGYIERETTKYRMGGTYYAPAIKDVTKTYKDKMPAYVLFLTDGENSDKNDTDNAIIKASKLPIFWQFVGVGRAEFNYLRKLDDMTDRYVDNADFFSVNRIENITYDQLLNEFPEWLANEKVKKMIK